MLTIALVGALFCTPVAFAAGGAPVKGNPKSKVYHKTGCHHYEAKGSTAEFKSEQEAVKAGFKPCKQCGKSDKKAAGEK